MILTTFFKKTSILRHAFTEGLHRSRLMAVLGLIVFSILIPVSTAALPEYSIFNIEYTHNQMKFRFFAESFAIAVNGAAVAYGAALGIILFRFMLDRRQTAFYFSLGLARKKLFIARAAAGMLAILPAIIAPMAVSLALNAYALGFTGLMLTHFIYVCTGLLLTAAVSFAAAAAACCISGAVVESICFLSILLLFPGILLFSIDTLARHMLLGNAFGEYPHIGGEQICASISEQLNLLNPVMFFYKYSRIYSVFHEGSKGALPETLNPFLFAAWGAAVFGIFAAALAALSRRRTENAGITGLNRGMNYFAAFTVGLLAFSAAVDVLAEINLIASLITAAAAFVSAYIIAGLSLAHNRKTRPDTRGLLMQLAIVLAAVLVMKGGGMGYGSHVPEPSEINYAEFSYVGTPGYMSVRARGSSNGKGYYIMSSYSYYSEEDLRAVTGLHKELVREGKRALGVNGESFAGTVVPYDIVISYSLKNGERTTRYYDRASVKTLERMLLLDDTEAVKKDMYDTVTGVEGDSLLYWAPGAFRLGDIYLSNSLYSNPSAVNMSEEKRLELLHCIARDNRAQSIDARYFPGKPALGVIMFSRNGESDSRSYAYNLQNTFVYVTPDFTRTLGFIKNNGLYSFFSADHQIESIELQRYSPYGGINKSIKPSSLFFQGYRGREKNNFIVQKDFGINAVIEEPDKINELAALLQNSYFMSDGGYLASVKLKGQDMYVYKYLPYRDAPKYVRNLSM